jgi:glycosyltransferase involved in cell wall biosynthesis
LLSLAFYSPSWPPGNDSNGIVTYVGTIVPALQAQGHVISVLSPAPDRGTATDGVYGFNDCLANRTLSARFLDRLARLQGGDYLRERRAWGSIAAIARRAVTERGVQLLEMEESFGWPCHVRRRIPIPLVVRLHGPWFLNGRADGRRADTAFHARVVKEGRALAAADGITAPSLDVLERTREYYGLALEHAEVIPNPVPPAPASTHWNPAECEPYDILFIGRFDLHKGGDIVVDAYRRVVQRIPQARLRFVGPDRGISRDGDRTWTLRDYTDDRVPGARESGQIEWLEEQPHKALAALRCKAAVTIVCSRYEVFGLTATEAMAQGCPLVATAAGALAEIVQDGANGLLCRPEDPEDLATKICFLLENPLSAQQFGRQAKLDSNRRYDPALLAARSVDYYKRVIARARTNSSPIITYLR